MHERTSFIRDPFKITEDDKEIPGRTPWKMHSDPAKSRVRVHHQRKALQPKVLN